MGKTALYHLLQGQPLPPAYVPSPEIRFSEISWTYKSSPDVIKVGVSTWSWDWERRELAVGRRLEWCWCVAGKGGSHDGHG